MSCRVISSHDQLGLKPVFSGTPAAEPEPLFRRGPSATDRAIVPGTDSPADVRLLHERVVELEEALQREVRLAREAGRQEGEATGRERARSELQPVLERLNKSVADLATLRSRIRQDSEAELVKLSLCIARRVLRRELTIDPEAVHGVVKAALDKVQAKDVRKVRVHPEFHSVVRRQLEPSGLLPAADIVADSSLRPGDVVVETRLGDLDASIESQLMEIERGFADRLNR
jgi:flagellar assembly protein FliH